MVISAAVVIEHLLDQCYGKAHANQVIDETLLIAEPLVSFQEMVMAVV